MGLDMFLRAKRHVRYDEGAVTIKSPKSLADAMIGRSITAIEVEAIYWRKANAIHGWFVNNVQDGNDDCREYLVGVEELKILLSKLKEAQKSKKKHLVLPIRSGSFFGSQEYGEDYYDDIKTTIEKLEEILKWKDLDDWDFYYSSSW